MSNLEMYVTALILACLVLYAVLGGADFGGGVWDLLATGPRADDQRRLIERSIAPIWEANHVWLIAVIVLLFACFPSAYAVISTSLHLPLTLMLMGIVMRGAAFVFRTYDSHREPVWRAWSRTFAAGSTIAPFMLGVTLGGAASGRVRVGPDGVLNLSLTHAWLAPFPILVGLFTVAVFAFLAATFLTSRTDDFVLQEAFRRRAMVSALAVTALAWATFAAAWTGAPHLIDGLWRSWWAAPFQLTTACAGIGLLHALHTRRFARARTLATFQVVALVCGFGGAQFPYLVTPDITFAEAAAPPEVLAVVAVGMTVGVTLLAPAYGWLLKVFVVEG